MNNKKVLIIGLDGVPWSLLNVLFSKEYLPTLKKLKENGTYGILESTTPPVTAPAWASFATGKNPGKHGIYDFVRPENSLSNIKPITSKDIKSITFYELLEKAGNNCILINMPVTYPPRIKGITITSFMTRGDNFVFPEILKNEITELKSYRIIPNISLLRDNLKEYIQDIRRLENIRFKCAQKLFKYHWDLFFILFSGTDWVNHIIYDKLLLKNEKDEAVKEAILLYQEIDEYIKWLVENSPPNTNIIIMSDHGFKIYTETFFINEWLRRKGYLDIVFQFKGKTHPHKLSEEFEILKKRLSIPTLIVKFVLSVTNFIPLDIFYALYTKIRKHLPFHLVFKLNPNFRRTTAYCVSSESRAIYLNTKERFSDGTINDAKTYRAVKKKLINELKQLKGCFNEPLFKAVMEKESVYNGYSLNDAPDIILMSNRCILANYFAPVVLSKTLKNDHDPYGIIITYGPDIKTKTIIRARIIDIAPTILHIFNLPIPDEMDGRVLTEIFETKSEIAKRKPKYVETSYYEYNFLKEKIRKLKKLKKI